MKHVYTLRFRKKNQQGMLTYSFVSSATFEQSLKSALQKVHRSYPSESVEPVSFLAEPGDEVPDTVGKVDEYER